MTVQGKIAERKKRKKGKSRPAWPFLILVFFLTGAGLYFFNLLPWGTEQPTGQNALPPKSLTEGLPQHPIELAAPPQPVTQPLQPPSFPSAQVGATQDTSAPPAPDLQEECRSVAAVINGFTTSLDRQAYIQEFALAKGTAPHFAGLAAKLFANPPMVTRETDDLYSILKNMAHFFHLLGQDNVRLVKEILERESGEIEGIFAAVYRWSEIAPKCHETPVRIALPLDEMYQYAAFFLNTIGGRSYLFRRDSRTRLLVNYYSLLVLDRIIDAKKNTHGLDIAALIPAMLQEVQASSSIAAKEQYIERLQELLEKHPRLATP